MAQATPSQISQKLNDFVREPIGEKSVKDLPGIDQAIGGRLIDKGINKAYVVFGQFLVMKKDEKMFVAWLKEEGGANTKQAGDCYSGLKGWCDNNF